MKHLIKTVKRTFSLSLCACLLLCQTGCSTDEILEEEHSFSESVSNRISDSDSDTMLRTVDLMAGVSSGQKNAEEFEISNDFLKSCTDFSVRLFQQSSTDDESGNNIMISPVSVLTALSMTANGAAGDTQNEMLKTIFGHLADTLSPEDLNRNMSALLSRLPSDEEAKLLQANSIWFLEDESGFQVNPDFLQTNADYYQADAFCAPFNDQTLADINQWVSEHTDHMIPSILDQIPRDAVMYLINALTFDAAWDSPYKEFQIRENEFTNEDGSISLIPMMYSDESLYLKTEHAEGFIKPYKEGYSFAALLPEEGISMDHFIQNLTGDSLFETLSNPVSESVHISIPKFTTEYSAELSETLINMGMELPFDSSGADFSSLGTCPDGENISISRVLHKTFISVDENGTRAGAATAVEILKESAIMNMHDIELNRPFIYMIIDQSSCLPVFMGTVTHLDGENK